MKAITFEDLATRPINELVKRTLEGELFYDDWSDPYADPKADFVNAFFAPGTEHPLGKYMNEYVAKMVGIPIVY